MNIKLQMIVLKQDVIDSYQSITRHLFRSVLSSLGIAIGVCALIVMLSISEGAKQQAYTRALSLGTDVIRIELNQIGSLLNKSQGLFQDDITYLNNGLGIKGLEIAGIVKIENLPFFTNKTKGEFDLIKSTHEWFSIEGLNLNAGRYWTSIESRNGAKVCIIGVNVSKNLGVKINDTIKYQSNLCQVIGILETKGSLLTEGTGLSSIVFDNSVFVPMVIDENDKLISGKIVLDGIIIKANKNNGSAVIQLSDKIKEILAIKHNNVDDFIVFTAQKLLKDLSEQQKTYNLIMGGIASLTLLVGGIGIMNIMLANFAEQIREIALRMAVGASVTRIVRYSIISSLIICIIGAFIGSILGIIVTIMVALITDWSTHFSILSIIIAPLFSIITGLLFGIYPGLSASRMQISESLREY